MKSIQEDTMSKDEYEISRDDSDKKHVVYWIVDNTGTRIEGFDNPDDAHEALEEYLREFNRKEIAKFVDAANEMHKHRFVKRCLF